MREILYIQAGPVSNYTGTHYWNTQESYFTYDESDVPLTDHSISFKEGQDLHVRPTPTVTAQIISDTRSLAQSDVMPKGPNFRL